MNRGAIDREILRKQGDSLRARGLVPNPWADPTWHGKVFRTKLTLKRWLSFCHWENKFFLLVVTGRIYMVSLLINVAAVATVLYIAFHFISKYW